MKSLVEKKGEDMNLIDQLRDRESFLSTVEVMDLLRITRNTLCNWVRCGRLTAVRVGNAYLYDPQMLADWLEGRKTSTVRHRRGK
jgi:excisionase family DNA binding protein